MSADQELALIHSVAWPLLIWLVAKLNRKGGNKCHTITHQSDKQPTECSK
jgi:hypothetical protein